MRTDLHDLTGVYAGGALPAEELPRTEKHLRDCPTCAHEARELLEIAARLGTAAATPPPAYLRGRVLAAAASTPQLAGASVLPLLRDARRHDTATGPDWRRPMHRWPLRAAACLAALAIGMTTSHALPGSGPRTVEQVQAQPSSPRTLTVTTAAAKAAVTVDAATARMTFTAAGLRALAPGRTYQLWLLEAAGPRPAGTFTLSPSGGASAVLAGPGRASTLLVTEEPAGGSAKPTTQRSSRSTWARPEGQERPRATIKANERWCDNYSPTAVHKDAAASALNRRSNIIGGFPGHVDLVRHGGGTGCGGHHASISTSNQPAAGAHANDP